MALLSLTLILAKNFKSTNCMFTKYFVCSFLEWNVKGDSMPTIQLDGLVKRYGAVEVLHGIDLMLAEK